MKLIKQTNQFHFSLGLSVFLHSLLFAAFVYLIVRDPFYWGGGLSGLPSVVVVELADWKGEGAEEKIEDGGLKVEDRRSKVEKKEVEKAPSKAGGKETAMTRIGYGEGDSPTPAGGKGSGFDAVSGQNRDPDVLALIRQRIIRAKSYPLAARRRGIEGTVKVLFRIGKEGGLDKVAVISSSGSVLLDDEAVATVKRGAPYPYYEGDISMGLKFDLKE